MTAEKIVPQIRSQINHDLSNLAFYRVDHGAMEIAIVPEV
jgi:hypothetical protein